MKVRSIVLLLAGLLAGTQAHAADFRMTIAFDKTNPATPGVGEFFARQLEARSNGRHKVLVTGPETTPSFEQLQPVAGGIFDFGLTTGGYHQGTITAALAIDGTTGNLDKLRASGLLDEIDKRYQRIGLKIVSIPLIEKDGYQIILREPVGASGDLKGRKLRAAPPYRPVLALLGATEVLMPNAETYAALEKGVVDGAAWTSVGILPAKFYEVNKLLLRPTFGRAHLLILMNLNRWNGLSKEDKKLVIEVGRVAEQAWITGYPKLRAEEEAALTGKHGMKITRVGDSFAVKMDQAWKDGAWDQAARRDSQGTEALRKLAKEKGLID